MGLEGGWLLGELVLLGSGGGWLVVGGDLLSVKSSGGDCTEWFDRFIYMFGKTTCLCTCYCAFVQLVYNAIVFSSSRFVWDGHITIPLCGSNTMPLFCLCYGG